MSHNQIPPALKTLPDELDENAAKIMAFVTMLKWILHLYTAYYAQLLREAVPFSSDIPVTVERLQSASLEMESLTRSLSSLQKTLTQHCPPLLRIMNSEEYQNWYYAEAGKFFL